MFKRIMWLTIVIFVGLAVFGCTVGSDPNGVPTVRIDAEKAEQFEKGAEAGISIMTALEVVWPGAAVLSTALATALAAWRNQKGKVIIEQSKAKMYHSASAGLVEAIADYRENNPNAWGKLKEELEAAIGPEAENVIRAIRGLPEKT